MRAFIDPGKSSLLLATFFVLFCLSGCGSDSSVSNAYVGQVPQLGASTFDFGDNFLGSTVTQQVATVTNTTTTAFQLSSSVSGDSTFTVPASSSSSCGTSLAAGASCALFVTYAPGQAAGTNNAKLNLSFSVNGKVAAPESLSLTGTAVALVGTVAPTGNSQVAQYTVQMPGPGSATISFGPTTSYGRQTWTQTTAAAGPLSIYVAGMLPNSTYHMQAKVQLTSGSGTVDTDHTFNTGTPGFQVGLAATTAAGMIPQSGVEQMSVSNGNFFSLVVADLQGNILWSYVIPGDNGGYNLEGAKLMSNGHFLVTLGQGSAYSLTGTSASGIVAVREIDLAGNTVRNITTGELSAKLQAQGYNITLQQFHHDVIPMSNGHWIVLSNEMRNFTNLTGIPGTTAVLGDVVVDLDENLNPVWVWDEFDHLDVNRHPMGFPDWTHTNALVYSPDDGNLIISIRHQNWVVKVDYANGGGSGNILWHLGEGGDFKLVGGTDPTDWQYAQHFPSLFSATSAGTLSLGVMDNGDDREFPPGVVCNTPGNPPCQYTTIPVYQLSETAKTATLTFHQILPASEYSFFGGNTELLANGNIEYDLAGLSTASSLVREITPTANPQTVWQMNIANYAYRAYRIPSLYPGVQW